MKKFVYTLAAAAMTFGFAACSSDEPQGNAPDGKTSLVTLTAQLPAELGSRDFGNGTTATTLTYAVYESDTKVLIEESADKINFEGLTANVELQLVNGKSYDIIFWADAPVAEGATNPYTFSSADKTITINYDGLTSNDESRDAFFASVTNLNVEGAMTKPVVLNRPFAQLNFGTDDLDAESVKPYITAVKTSVSTTSFKTLNLLDGTVGDPTTVTYALAGRPDDTETFPYGNGEYKYLSMNYLLVGGKRDVVDIDFTVNDGTNDIHTLDINNVPVERNYRTNIYGSLITSAINFRIEIDPEFGKPSHDVGQWDGTTVKTPVINETDKTVTVSEPSEFMGLAALVNGTAETPANDFEGYTITLTSDIDFANKTVSTIAAGAKRNSSSTTGNAFKGVLDGGNKTLKNITINSTDADGDAIAAFITNLVGPTAEVKNLKIENLNITADAAEQAGFIGLVTEGAKVTNVHVLSGTISAKGAAGGVVGRMMIDGTIADCSNGATVTSTKNNVGGIAGAAYYTAVGKTMTISNCSNSGNITAGGCAVGGISGLNAADVTSCSNTGAIKGNNYSVGGVIGEQTSRGTVSKCVNNGSVTNTGAGYGTGGVIGWVRYNGSNSSYASKSAVTVSECENYASVTTAGQGAGGIVGIWYEMGTIEKCINKAPSLHADKGWVAGIVGAQQYTEANGPSDAEPKLYVTANKSKTTLNRMTGGSMKDEFIYVNSTDKVTLSGNEMITE